MSGERRDGAGFPTMLWFFRRAGHTTSIELQFEEEAGDFVLTVTPAELASTVERFRTYEGLAARVTALEEKLESEGWRQDGAPVVLPTGWRTNHRLTRH